MTGCAAWSLWEFFINQTSGENQVLALQHILNDLSLHSHTTASFDPGFLVLEAPPNTESQSKKDPANRSDGLQCHANGVCLLTFADDDTSVGVLLVEDGDNGSLPDAQGMGLQVTNVSVRHCQQWMSGGLQSYVYVSYPDTSTHVPQNRCLDTEQTYDLWIH